MIMCAIMIILAVVIGVLFAIRITDTELDEKTEEDDERNGKHSRFGL